jgi:hypothetical protein
MVRSGTSITPVHVFANNSFILYFCSLLIEHRLDLGEFSKEVKCILMDDSRIFLVSSRKLLVYSPENLHAKPQEILLNDDAVRTLHGIVDYLCAVLSRTQILLAGKSMFQIWDISDPAAGKILGSLTCHLPDCCF